MNFKQKLIYIGFGSVLTMLGFVLATLVMDVDAQNEKVDGHFKTVYADRIEVNDRIEVGTYIDRVSTIAPIKRGLKAAHGRRWRARASSFNHCPD